MIPATERSAPKYELPFSGWWPIVAGAALGLALRLVFHREPGHSFATMMGSFVLLTPVLVGMLTVFLAEARERRSWAYYAGAPAIANALFVFGSFVALIEGAICAILVLPLFMALGAIGGLMMGAACRRFGLPRHTLYSFLALPFALGALENRLPLSDRIRAMERHVLVGVPPEKVWPHVWNVRDIRPEEVQQAWMYKLGVPLPISAVTQESGGGFVRKIRMGKAIHFDQLVTDWQANRYVLWKYRFSEDSFPPAALDDHVRIGGMYFDMRTTSYALAPVAGGTQLTIRMEYRVTTPFNWYAGPLADFLVNNFEEVILSFYKERSEHST